MYNDYDFAITITIFIIIIINYFIILIRQRVNRKRIVNGMSRERHRPININIKMINERICMFSIFIPLIIYPIIQLCISRLSTVRELKEKLNHVRGVTQCELNP